MRNSPTESLAGTDLAKMSHALPEHMGFKLSGKTILVVSKKFGLFLGPFTLEAISFRLAFFFYVTVDKPLNGPCLAYLLARSSASFFPGELEAEHPRSAMVAVMGRSQGCVPLRNQAVHNIANMCFSVYTYMNVLRAYEIPSSFRAKSLVSLVAVPKNWLLSIQN